MLTRPGLLGQVLFRFFFSLRRVRADDLEQLRELDRTSRVVYVASHKHVYSALWLNHALQRWGLALAGLMTGVITLFFAPVGRWLAYLLGRRPKGSVRARARQQLDQGGSLVVFLRKGRKPGRRGICPGSDEVLLACMDAERARIEADERPVVLVPLSLFWGASPLRPDSASHRGVSWLLGPAEDPGALRSFLQLFFHFRGQRLRIGEPLGVSQFLQKNADLPDEQLERRLRYELATRVERVRRVYQGPKRKGSARIRRAVLTGRHLREVIHSLSEEKGIPEETLRKQAARYLKEIAAEPDPFTLNIFRGFLRHFVWFRIYDGLEVNPEDMARLRAAAHRGPLIFLPTHRSHMDYLLISWIVAEYDVAPPLIAAGVNLSFFPIGGIFRRSGAFFLRRSFWQDRLYTTCLTDYLRKNLAEGYNLEFFIEGTRSRTGKMYMPRIGLLKWVAEAALTGRVRGAQLVPMAIGYEKVLEERAISREASGGKKRKEDVRGLFRAGRVLASRFGRLNLQIGEPYDLQDALAKLGATKEASPETRAQAVVQLAYRIVYEISRVSAVTPTALVSAALLLPGERRVVHDTLVHRARWIAERLAANGARFSRGLAVSDDEDRAPSGCSTPVELRAEGLDKALQLLASERSIRIEGSDARLAYALEDDRRVSLGYYRNGLINFLAPESVLARAVLTVEAQQDLGAPLPLSEVRQQARFLSRLWKHEFVFAPGQSFDERFDATLAHLGGGYVVLGEDHVTVVSESRETLRFMALLLQDYLEAYQLAVLSLRALLHGPMGRRNLVRRMRDDANRAFLRGELLRRESCHRLTFDNAVSALVDLGVLAETVGKSRYGTPMALQPGHNTGTDLTALLDQVSRLNLEDLAEARTALADHAAAARARGDAA